MTKSYNDAKEGERYHIKSVRMKEIFKSEFQAFQHLKPGLCVIHFLY